jgi:glycosyltransferase involved in cell wall biosynthesis
MNNTTNRTDNSLVICTEFFPLKGKNNGPWGERFNGLYLSVFNKYKSLRKNVIWYSISERCVYTGRSGEVIRREASLYSFLLKTLHNAFFQEKRISFLIVYPIFRLREFHKSLFIILILKALNKTKHVNIIIDFLEPPLLIISLNKINHFFKKVMLLVSAFQEKAYLKVASRILTGGDQMSCYLSTTYKIDITKFAVIEQGINVSDYGERSANISHEEFTIFYGGLLSKDRGIEELIDCIEKINKLYPVNLLCCGKIHPSLKLPRHSWLKVYTKLDYDEYVNKMLKYADVGILPYPVNDWWGKISVSKLATYAAAGIPIISTALPHTELFLRRWNCGHTAKDWHGIESLIIKLYRDRDLCKILGRNARIAAEQALDWPVLVEKLENILSQLAAPQVTS